MFFLDRRLRYFATKPYLECYSCEDTKGVYPFYKGLKYEKLQTVAMKLKTRQLLLDCWSNHLQGTQIVNLLLKIVNIFYYHTLHKLTHEVRSRNWINCHWEYF